MNDETEAAKAQKTTMQNVVQQMLPDDLKKQFVLQKSGGVGQPAATPTPTATTLDPNLVQKSIRTFESDLAEALAHKQGSSASIAIAENKRKDEISRAIEGTPNPKTTVPPQQQPAMARTMPSAVRPNSATAIPGVTIGLVPNVPRNENSDISDTIRAVSPNAPITQKFAPVAPPAQQAPIKVPDAMIVPEIEIPRRSYAKPIILSLLSLALIAGGVYTGVVLYQKGTFDKPEPVVQTEVVVPSIIPHDKQIKLAVNGEASVALITKMYAEINKNQVASGKNLELVIPLKGQVFIEKLDTKIPSVILRSLTDRFMFGVYGEDTGQKTSFLALTTDFFQNAFAGMLMWEDSMPDDLALLLNFKDRARKDELNATSSIASYFTIRGSFSDKVIKNRDVREFRNPKGELLFLYSFINKETVLLTTTESAFSALIDRIEKDAYVR